MELSILRNYQQTPNKIIKNQGENKNRKNTFDSHQFIHFIADSAISDRAFIYFYIYRVLPRNFEKITF